MTKQELDAALPEDRIHQIVVGLVFGENNIPAIQKIYVGRNFNNEWEFYPDLSSMHKGSGVLLDLNGKKLIKII